MKHNSRISTVSILGVLCMCMTGTAYGAASVRSLGGAGTYAGTASAGGTTTTTATPAASSTSAARAGSVRVTSSSNKNGSSASISSGNSGGGRGAATSRLSVGKYLGSAMTGTGRPLKPNVSLPSGGGDTVIAGDLQKIVDALQINVDAIKGSLTSINEALDRKQNLLSANDGLVEIDDNNEIFINVDNLITELKGHVDGDVKVAVTEQDGKKYISWCHVGENNECDANGWQQIVDMEELRGEKGDSLTIEDLKPLLPQLEAILDAKIKVSMANYYTKAEIDNKLSGMTAGAVTPAPDGAGYAWVSLGGTQQWVSIVGVDAVPDSNTGTDTETNADN